MERTFAMIKPNAIKNKHVGRILQMIEEDGFNLAALKLKTFSKADAEGFYAEHKDRPFFPNLVKFMTSGPVLVLILEASGAVDKWRKLMGATDPAKAAPGTIRKIFGESVEANSTHGSDSPTSAAREIQYIFGKEL
jgi:nucleoside-diphosphate kinase